MGSYSPLQIALFIVGGLAAIGVVVTYLRSRMTYSGYEDIHHDIRKLGVALKGEIFRDGSDVVVSGSWEKVPAVVRFSNQENTPGLNIRMPAPASFQISVTAAGTQVTEGPRTPVKTSDDMFDARFTTRTDQPTQARMLLNKSVTGILQKLACSKNTYIAIGSGSIEQSELVIPSPNAAQHVIDHLKSMTAFSAALRNMPGADRVKLVTLERERHVFARLVMIVGVVVAIASIVAAIRVPPDLASVGANEGLNTGILPVDAALILDAATWHAAAPQEIDNSGAEMLRSFGVQPSGRIEGDYGGTGNGQDVAYLLVNAENKRRIVIIVSHVNRYDVRFPAAGMIARVPKENVGSIRWTNDKGPQDFLGDGLLIVRQTDKLDSGVVVFMTAEGVTSAVPKSWHDVPLR